MEIILCISLHRYDFLSPGGVLGVLFTLPAVTQSCSFSLKTSLNSGLENSFSMVCSMYTSQLNTSYLLIVAPH